MGRPVLLSLLVAFLVGAVPLWWGLPDWTGWAHDEVLPSRVLDLDKWQPKYPPLHRDLLRGLFALVGPLAERAGAAPGGPALHTALFVAARGLSLAMAVGIVWLVYRCARAFCGRPAAALGAAAVAGMPPFAYYAKTANLDVPYVFWFTLSLWFFSRLWKRRRTRDFVLFACAAALAVGTKDQAYGLYLLAPLPLVAVVAAERVRGGAPRGRALLAALGDRRLWLALAAGAALFAAIHRVLPDPQPFLRHLRVLLGPASEGYRIFPSTARGQLEMAALAGRHLAFTTGLPLLVVAVVGLASALRRPRPEAPLLWLGSFGLAYYLGFIAVVGFHYVRFFLPLGILAALFAARGFERLLAAPRPSRGARLALALGIVAWSLLRAASVDLLLLRDPRYRVEAWLAGAEGGAAAGFGGRKLLPRGVEPLSLKRWREGECRFLARRAPGLLVVGPAWIAEPEESRVALRLLAGELGWGQAFRVEPPDLPFLSLRGVLSNLEKVAAEIVVLRRTGRPCLDAHTLPGVIEELRRGGESPPRGEVARAILDHRIPGRRAMGEGVVAFGLSGDRWTRGRLAAAVAMRNPGAAAVTPRLRLATEAPVEALPQRVLVTDGVEPIEHLFTEPGRVDLELAPLPPGGERLVLLAADSDWSPAAGDRRRLGVRLLAVELRGAAAAP